MPSVVRHDVSFYDDRTMLECCIVDYALEGLDADETVVLIVAASSLPSVRQAIAAQGADVDDLCRRRVLMLFDADATLGSVTTRDGIDWPAVTALAGRVVGDAKSTSRPMRLFGEMVALLWQRGDVQAALDLEKLWDELAHQHCFDVLCAYPTMATTVPGAARPINAMCALHDATVSIDNGRHPVELTSYPCEIAAVPAARRRVSDMWPDSTNLDALGDALVIVSELAANAVEHARTPFTVEVQRSGDLARLVVRDDSVLQPVVRHPHPATRGGRGLALVNLLADSWGVTQTPQGKLVWATLRIT